MHLYHFRLFKTSFSPNFLDGIYFLKDPPCVPNILIFYSLHSYCIICSTNRDSIRQRFERIMQTNPNFHYFFPFSKGNRVFDR